MESNQAFGKYKVLAEIGRGAMGTVFAAEDTVIGRKVAIKKLHAHVLESAKDNGKNDIRERFLCEARAIGSCFHPNIVTLFDYGETEDGIPYLVMELLSSRDLKHVMVNDDNLGTERALKIIKQVLSAIGYAHECGVVHRDIKPANILLTEDGTVKVTDFGVAHLDQSELTATGLVLGTPSYMSPEQLQGEAIDERSDLFSVGILLYELVTGRKPFSNASAAAAMHEILSVTPKMPSKVRSYLTDDYDRLVRKALAKKKEYRFQTASDFIAEIDKLLGIATDEAEAEQTVVVAPPSRQSAQAGAHEALVSDAEKTAIEHELTSHIGPIAKMMMKQAMRQADDFDSLIETLAEQLPSASDAKSFIAKYSKRATEMTRFSSADSSASKPVSSDNATTHKIPAEILLDVEAELKNYIGPIAGPLIQRASFGASTIDELYERLVQHIPSAEERDAFLKSKTMKTKF